MATGCVKILKRAFDFDHLGKFIPEHKRGQDVDLFRGEFVNTILFFVCSFVVDILFFCFMFYVCTNTIILPGCFLISTPDVCYDAKDGYTYCWCSSGDLCNGGDCNKHNLTIIITIIMFMIYKNY